EKSWSAEQQHHPRRIDQGLDELGGEQVGRRNRRGDEQQQIVREEEGGEAGDQIAKQQDSKKGEEYHAERFLAQDWSQGGNRTKVIEGAVKEPKNATPEHHNQYGQYQGADLSAAIHPANSIAHGQDAGDEKK